MKLVITGGSGFLGYHICKKYADDYDDILLLDIDPYEPSEYPEKVRFKKVDIRDINALQEEFTGMDAVVHAAAALPLWKKEDIYAVNVDGTRNVFEAALKNNIQRVVLISSTAVYGVPDHHPLYENDPLIGVGPYGETKIEAERICEQYRKQGMIIPIIRPKTFIGTARLGVFQILFDWVESGTRIPIIGKGNNLYQLLEVEDLVDAIQLSLTLPDTIVNDTFNVGAREYQTVAEDVGALCEYAGKGSKPLRTPSWLVIPVLEIFWMLRISPLYKWVYGTAHKDSFVSVEKAEKQLGWKPKFSNAQALIRSYQWYLEHKEEIKGREGITHRVAWKQGILSIVKKFL